MEKSLRTFRDLRMWQKGIELVKEIYCATAHFPREERYGISSQMRRASISIVSNIAEGFRRRHGKEQKQFFNIAIGSCAELETQLCVCKELSYITEDDEGRLSLHLNNICGMIVNFGRTL